MNDIERIVNATTWMLLHSLWQGLILIIIAGILLVLARKTHSSLRYIMIAVIFFSLPLAAVATFIREYNLSSPPNLFYDHKILDHDFQPYDFIGTSYNDLLNTIIDFIYFNSGAIVFIWLLIVTAKLAFTTLNLIHLNTMRTTRLTVPAGFWIEKINNLGFRIKLKKIVSLFESGHVNVPIVIGHIKPIILVPVGFFSGLPSNQVEAILIHELAHIKRNDYVVNLIQNVTESIFFFNPGVLWVSSLLRQERENCCDDIAIGQTANRKEYVQALITFKTSMSHGHKYVTAFPGSRNHLLDRISRIAHKQNSAPTIQEIALCMISVLLIIFISYDSTAYKKISSHLSIPSVQDKLYTPLREKVRSFLLKPSYNIYAGEIRNNQLSANYPKLKQNVEVFFSKEIKEKSNQVHDTTFYQDTLKNKRQTRQLSHPGEILKLPVDTKSKIRKISPILKIQDTIPRFKKIPSKLGKFGIESKRSEFKDKKFSKDGRTVVND